MSETQTTTRPSREFWWGVGVIFLAILAAVFLCNRWPEEPHIGAICQVILLGVAAGVAAWYADVTRQMADATRGIAEATRQANVRALRADVKLCRDPKDKSQVQAYNEGPGTATEVAFDWVGDGAGHQPMAKRLLPHEDSGTRGFPPKCDGAWVTYASLLGRESAYYENDQGTWRPAAAPAPAPAPTLEQNSDSPQCDGE